MIKLFISQPMAGKSKEEIFTNRNKAIAIAKYLLGDEDVEVIDSYSTEEMTDLGYLGYSIMQLSKADVAYFDKGWKDARGCKIEYLCSVEYGIRIIEYRDSIEYGMNFLEADKVSD